jgi:putative spermidine/putrescine transport system ATP-binding protein
VTEGTRGKAFDELVLDGLTRTFGGLAALSDLTVTIPGGEFIALLGPSGCGKSTALNLLAGLLEPTAGAIFLDGQRIDTLPSERRDFGMVFQNYALFPHLTVADNVGFGLTVRGVRKAERRRRVRQALDLVRLSDQEHKYPGQLSGGQQQRVAIARAVVTEPRLVLMDEPLSNLDAKLRLDMRTEIRLLHQQLGLTTVYVTHDQAEALSLADRLIVLRDGLVQQIGPPEEVYQRPANAYVAAFIGYRNAVDAEVVTRGDGGVRVAGGGVELVSTSTEAGATTGPVVAMTRPEDLVVVDAPAGEVNVLDLTVRVAEYQGQHFAVEGRTDGGLVLHCQSPHHVGPGTRVRVRVAPERVRVYPAEGGATEAASAHALAGDAA